MKKSAPLVRLVHWNEEEATARLGQIAEFGFKAVHDLITSTPLFRAIDKEKPAAVVIDLTRMPSHGRHVGQAMRLRKSTRAVPLVFAGGVEEKVALVREMMPDAVYTTWEKIGEAIREAIRTAPAQPVMPPDFEVSKPGKLLVEKLGVKPGSKLVMIDAPRRAESLIEPLPEGARVEHGWKRGDLLMWFCGDVGQFQTSIAEVLRLADPSPVWIAWPKQKSKSYAGLTQNTIRESGMALGWVDCKICSIDDTWSGLLFRKRKAK